MGLKSIWTQHRRRREIIARFRKFAACSLEMARPLGEMELSESRPMRKLLRQQVVRREQRRYYLDEQALMQRRMNAAKWGMILLFLLLGLIFLRLNA